MKTPYQQQEDFNRRQGIWKAEILLPVNKVVDWFKDRRVRRKENQSFGWQYDGCDCDAKDGARSVPYCEKHFNPLTRKET